MAGLSEYEAHDALGLVDLVRRRKVTPAEPLDATITRLEARNPTVNAVVLRSTTTPGWRSPTACPTGRRAVSRTF